jgi:hypothetical protein
VEAERRQWPDACLGLAGEGEACAEVIAPGWRITPVVGDEACFPHTDEDTNAVRLEE